MNDNYIGHSSQIKGVEEHYLIGGKGDGMHLLQVRNGKGLEFTVLADRCADISRLTFHGTNMAYFSPCGYVGPQYYDKDDFGFLKSFTCGFLTTCGLRTIGSPSVDQGENFPLHGNISNVPAEQIYYTYQKGSIDIHARMIDAQIFKHKLLLERTISCSTEENKVTITDRVTNEGSDAIPLMLLYHFNIGYPLLDEHAELYIPSGQIIPRDPCAEAGLPEWNKMIPPQKGYNEQCFYHQFLPTEGKAMIYNPTVEKGLSISYPTKQLDHFVQWKMMGEKDYVLGLEPCNHVLDGRKTLRENDKLKLIEVGETKVFDLTIHFYDNKLKWEAAK